MTQNRQKTTIERVLLDVLAFGIGLSCAYFLKWKTTDLVWSLWLSSLVVGYLTILSILGCGAVFGTALIRHKDLGKQRLPAILGGIALGAVPGFVYLRFLRLSRRPFGILAGLLPA